MTIIAFTIARPAVMTEGGGFVPSAVAVTAPYAPRGPIIAGTSDTTNTLISTGAGVVHHERAGLEFHEGARLRASVIGGSNLYLEGEVVSYDTIARLLTLAVDLSSAVGGSYSNGRSTSPASLARPGRVDRLAPLADQPVPRDQRACRDRPASTASPARPARADPRAHLAHLAAPPDPAVPRGRPELPARAGRPVRAGRSDRLAAR